MENVISVSLGEIALKGLNRGSFEAVLIKQIKKAIKDFGFSNVYKDQGKIYIEADERYFSLIVKRLTKVFGIVYISPCLRVEKNIESIEQAAKIMMMKAIDEKKVSTFKVKTNRVDKEFPIKSPEFSGRIGEVLLKTFDDIKVDVHNPDTFLYIDIKKECYVYTEKVKGYGGLPVGTNGKGLLLLSGGIDSPVAGFLMAKRGVKLSIIHYHSYPFTSERSEQKVKELAEMLTHFNGEIKFYSINILNIQKAIHESCPEDEMTIISRRFMMRIADMVAEKEGCDAIITGESLGQVASQTIDGIKVTDNIVDRPVFRPLIGFDKVEIIKIAKDIETYEKSIEPFDDCCTVFLPKHPVTRPKIETIEESEKKLNIDELIEEALNKITVTIIK
ncbi:tRNA 4-thiouridine(8) synthase ThiI [Acidilutibacter cellobiosedens]|jgi:thiamine biosynthesis protein ThiI|uniref:Probable tRNA sulfurtransferase n=1 Tax=Acidilutibacter cellobiosedens TaxID=2507161 RepID=A0A410QE73_9FIRM|nr:tRNA uracil 4-sulfurtransferase ThiI [Acidilutibacter cellobiosedens]QAT62275.1 tRNA 4-thiouridine(8) synthase ThiI [Acidilutibacter cellobiosedens]